MANYKILEAPIQNSNDLYYLYKAQDAKRKKYFAHVFTISKLQKYNVQESIQYNQEVFTDIQDYAFPQHFLQIKQSIPNQKYFTFLTQPYETDLQTYIKTKVISQNDALRIFDEILKAIYSLYINGYWHKNIRLQHFVKVGNKWKMKSTVYSQVHQNIDLKSEYVWYQSYQPPQAYQQSLQKFDDQDFYPVVVWNLGSLLLDLIFSVHKLKNFNVLKKFYKEQFSLQAIGVKNTKIISQKLQAILSKMLHYDSLKRMKLTQVFKNQYLSSEVAAKYQKRLKSNKQAKFHARIFTGGKSTLSVCLLNPQQQIKGEKMLALTQVLNQFHQLDKKKEQVKQTQKQKQQSEGCQQNVFKSLEMISNFVSKNKFQNKQQKEFQSSQNQIQNESFKKMLQIYQMCYNQAQLLLTTSKKFQDIPFKNNSQEVVLLSKYAVSFVSLLNFNQILFNLSQQINFLRFETTQFQKFKKSKQYSSFQQKIKQKTFEIKKSLEEIKQKLRKMQNSEKQLSKDPEIQEFLSLISQIDFHKIKNAYRKILRVSYDVVSQSYNQNQKQELARLGFYIVYCLTEDKLYLQSYIQDNFKQFFQWCNIAPSKYVDINQFKKYLDNADAKKLISHARKLLFSYFKNIKN